MKQTLKFLGLLLFLLSIVQPVFSHGTVIYPPSRIYNCYNNPSDSPCGSCGTAIYDWMGVLQPDTNFGNHRALIPDGQIASGGNGSAVDFSCLDALTTDWTATTVNHGYIDVKWQNTAPHTTEYYKVYITQLSWDPTQPLRWDDLIEIGHVGKGPAESFTTIRSFIPDSYAGKRAALVSIWQRDYNHSHEAFYAVSDILVQGGGGDCNTGDAVSATFSNNTDCTLRYHENGSFKGSANAGGSFTGNTTIGSQWEAQNSTGNPIDNFTVICDQTTYVSSGECNEGNDCTTGDAVSITFTNNTDCSLQYYQNNALQGSANTGSSFTANTTIGSQWEARDTLGNQIGNFTIVCSQTTYNSTGACDEDDDCNGIPAWSSTTTYSGGETVKYSNSQYRAKWWTLNQTPDTHSGEGLPWENIGSCTNEGNIVPTVSITSPTNSTSFNQGDSIAITASASDSDGTITKVEFFNGSTKLGEDTTSPYSYTITNAAAGSYTLSAKATDNENAATTSSTVSVTVIGSTNGCTGITQYVAGTSYNQNQEVQNEGSKYTCNIPGWCSSSAAWAYAPGTGIHWQSAWSKSGDCTGAKSASPIAFRTYPNPVNNTLHISIQSDLSDSNFNLKIYSVSGAKVLSFTNNSLKSGNSLKTFDLSQLESGLYLYTISIAEKGIKMNGKIQKN